MRPRPIPPRGRGATSRLVVLAAMIVLATPAMTAGAAAHAPVSADANVRDVVPDIPTGGHLKPRPLARIANLPDGGGIVLHSNRTHLVFWAPAGSGLGFDAGYPQQLEMFLARVAHDSHLPTNVYSLSGQYYDDRGPAAYDSTYAGSILDTEPLPTRDPLCIEPAAPPVDTGPGWSDCVSDQQIQNELTRVTTADKLPTTQNDIYILITPEGLGDCDTTSSTCALGGTPHNGYCGYHSSTPSNLLYAVIPYNAVPGHCQSDGPRPNASTADPAISSLSHEHNEVITDPLGDAWIDSEGNEDGDLCLDETLHPPRALGGSGQDRYDQVIDGGHYWTQLEWSNEDDGCAAHDETDPLMLSAPVNPRPETSVTLTAHGRDPDGRIVSYLWAFGDGSVGHGARARHVYRGAGRYTIRLRSTDSAGNWAFATRTITVTRAPASGHQSGPRRG